MDYQSERARAVWRSCLSSAFRTALACSIVGCAILFGPAFLRRRVTFPTFSYVTVILVVTDAALGDALRGCWFALGATMQGACPAILSLWIIGPSRLTAVTTALAVALNAFLVVLPEDRHLISRRIALGQIVIVYVVAFINGVHTQPVMHPVHVAASTALGVLASVLALLLPFPSLASFKVRQKSKLFKDNAAERLKLFVKAFCAEDNTSSQGLMAQARPLAINGDKLLASINSKKEGMKWEQFPFKFFFKSSSSEEEERCRLQDIQASLKGMEIALSGCSSFPLRIMQEQDLLVIIKEGVNKVEQGISRSLHAADEEGCLNFGSSTVPETSEQTMITVTSSQVLENIIPTYINDLPSCFFLFCLRLLHHQTVPTSPSVLLLSSASAKETTTDLSKKHRRFVEGMRMNTNRLMPALRCSLSLGFAVFLGLRYSKEDGYWSGLPIAISLASAREATFKVANIKAQGTVLGTVYGVLGCFVFEKFAQARFLSLLPWFIFTSFLRRSRMYGQAGGISAVIGAVLILGRKDFGPPSEFAIARIVETFIGLSCSIMVDLILQPTRASSLARVQLSKSLKDLHDCIISISLRSGREKMEQSRLKLRDNVNLLRNFIEEAEAEPSFWFLPFHSASYHKLSASLSKAGDFLIFGAHAIGFLQQESQIRMENWKEKLIKLDGEVELFKELAAPSIKSMEEISLIKSIPELDQQLTKNNKSVDQETGNSSLAPKMFRLSGPALDGEIEKILSSYHRESSLSEEVILDDLQEAGEDGDDAVNKSKLVLSLGALVFCTSNLVRETKEIEKGLEELLRWENPCTHVNLLDIFCKIQTLQN